MGCRREDWWGGVGCGGVGCWVGRMGYGCGRMVEVGVGVAGCSELGLGGGTGDSKMGMKI